MIAMISIQRVFPYQIHNTKRLQPDPPTAFSYSVGGNELHMSSSYLDRLDLRTTISLWYVSSGFSLSDHSVKLTL